MMYSVAEDCERERGRCSECAQMRGGATVTSGIWWRGPEPTGWLTRAQAREKENLEILGGRRPLQALNIVRNKNNSNRTLRVV